jgi:hypothetical protein
MATSSNSPDTNSNPSISSAEAIPASRSAKPESAAEPTTPGIFGRSSRDYFAFFDPATCSWKTSQGTLALASDLFSETFPDSGTMRNGRVYALRTSARVTSGNGCSLWPTAVADATGRTPESRTFLTYKAQSSLSVKVQTWPTASASIANDGESLESWERRKAKNLAKYDNGNGMGTPLTIAAIRWPTARAEDSESAGNHPVARMRCRGGGL